MVFHNVWSGGALPVIVTLAWLGVNSGCPLFCCLGRAPESLLGSPSLRTTFLYVYTGISLLHFRRMQRSVRLLMKP